MNLELVPQKAVEYKVLYYELPCIQLAWPAFVSTNSHLEEIFSFSSLLSEWKKLTLAAVGFVPKYRALPSTEPHFHTPNVKNVPLSIMEPKKLICQRYRLSLQFWCCRCKKRILNWQRWDSNPRHRNDWYLKPGPYTTRPRYPRFHWTQIY